jgi:hypothetical protein
MIYSLWLRQWKHMLFPGKDEAKLWIRELFRVCPDTQIYGVSDYKNPMQLKALIKKKAEEIIFQISLLGRYYWWNASERISSLPTGKLYSQSGVYSRQRVCMGGHKDWMPLKAGLTHDLSQNQKIWAIKIVDNMTVSSATTKFVRETIIPDCE